MKKIDELKNQLEVLKEDAQTLLNAKKVDEAKAKMEEAKILKEAISLQEQLDKEEAEILNKEAKGKKEGMTSDKTKENASAIRAMIKKVTGAPLTEAENALLLPSTEHTTGEHGESYILPEDISTLIRKKIRQYRSLREVIGYIPTSALTGSFPVEDFETVSELVDFADGTDGQDSNDIKFKNVSFSLKEKAAFIKLSNTLLKLTDNALIAYIVEVFAKKAVITENKMIITVLKSNKSAKALKDWKALKSSINVDLDPAVLFGSCIVTNQTGFDYMDSALDETGRPILQPNPTNSTQKLFNGQVIHVFSDAMLPNNEKKAPIFYGNLAEAVKFVDLNGQVAFATSTEAGFMSNTTIARLIEFIDVVQCDKSDKCYIYGEFDTTPEAASVSSK